VRHDLERSGVAVVVGEAGDGGEAIDVVLETTPDVVVMDLTLPTVRGIDAITAITTQAPATRILVLSMSDADTDVLEAVKVGASGYVLKSSSGDEIVDAVRRVAVGDAVFTPTLAGVVLGEFRRASTADGGEPSLTKRENEILRLVARGYAYGDIADELYISRRTVQNHVRNILGKLQLRKRYELMRFAIERGLDR
jgi:DNA-binding NarL/FixJ family response regulator